jgi:phosphohistidine phosphatase
VAKHLWLLRHGEAEPHEARPDAERELTDRGREQSVDAGRALAALDVVVQLAFTSPKVRARDTARLACAEIGVEPVEHEPLASGFDRDEALALLHAAGDDRRVLAVGHEPDFSQVVHDLTGARIDLKKGGIAGVRMDGARGELVVLLRPREITPIARAAART